MLLVDVAKITPPRSPHILYRQRLIDRLEQHRDKKLILILGPAAQGKSTLALSYLMTSERPSAWVNLGPEESDPVNLFYLLGQSLQQALPEVDLTAALHYPALSLGPREELPLYRDWNLALLDRLRRPVQVILDGLDRLAPEAPSFRFLQVLLDCLPPPVHLFMLSREMPPLEIQALKMRQEAFILSGEELAFTREETRTYLQELRRMPLPADLLTRFQDLTEGWVGGLVLLSESLERAPETLREKYLAGSLTERFKEEIFRYFGECIFSTRSLQDQDFLLRSSILEVVDPNFIQDFLGLAHAREILEDLTNRNLFIQAIHDPKKGWVFRYHQLFRGCLQRRFQTTLSQPEQRAVYLKAALLCEQKGEPEEALKFCFKAQAQAEAAALLEKIGLDLLSMGRTGDLARWLEALPADLVQENPWLLLYLFMTLRFSGAREDIFRLQRAHALFEAQGAERGMLLSLAYLLEAASFRGNLNMSISDLAAKGEALLASFSSDQHPYERTVLSLQVGLFYSLRGGDPSRGFQACRNAFLLAQGLGDLSLQVNASVNAYLSLVFHGLFPEAEEWGQLAEKLVRQCDYPELQANYLFVMCHSAIFQGDLAKAEKILHLFKETAQRHDLRFIAPVIMNCDLFLHYLQGRYAQAEEIGRAHYDLSCALGNRWAQGMGLNIWGMSYHHKGDWLKARETLQRGREISSTPEGYSVPLIQITKLHLGLIAINLGEITPDTEREVQEALDHWSSIPAPLWMADSHLVMALLRWAQERPEEAATHLQTALAIARERGYHHFFATNPRELAHACLLALELEVPDPERDYAGHLLHTHLADLAGPGLAQLAVHPDERVADRARKLRRAIKRSRTPRLRLQTLGAFQLWRGEVLMAENEWGGNLPKLLLKAIIANRSKFVPREMLHEDLWPETDPEDARKNFKANLHRLRKALEPALHKEFGSSYVHLKGDLVSLDPDLCSVDADEFLALIKEAREQEAQGRSKEALDYYNRALELYGGDFLPGDPYAAWAQEKREELRQIYGNLLFRLAELYEKRGAVTKALALYKKLVHNSPLHEEAYQRLMLLQAGRGMPSAALQAYQDCRGALQRELGIEPGEITTAIYRKILDSA